MPTAEPFMLETVDESAIDLEGPVAFLACKAPIEAPPPPEPSDEPQEAKD